MDTSSDIYRYTDYRVFLRDYFVSRKKTIPGFSYRLLAAKIGFSSPAFFKLVVDGKKNLSKESVFKLSQALSFNAKAADYFENLVFFNQSKDINSKSYFMDRLQRQQPKDGKVSLLPPEYGFLRKWYYSVIREMADLHEFNEDPEWISHKLAGRISPVEAEKASRFLLDHGFWVRKENGKLAKKNLPAMADEAKDAELASAISRHFHVQMLDVARDAAGRQGKESKNFAATFCFSKQGHALALEKIVRLRKELLEIAASDWIADRVFQLNVNFFPLTDPSKVNGPDPKPKPPS